MTQHSKILVTGATGNVGGQLVSQLLAQGAAVRALTRDPGSAELPDGVEAVPGDLSIPDSLAAALDGVGAVFLMWPFHTAEPAPALLDVIGKHAGRVAFLSSGAVKDGLDLDQQAGQVGRWHAEVEQAIERSGLEWSILRPGAFAANALWWAPQIRAGDVVRGAYGSVAMNPLHERDIAAVAVCALTGDGHHGAKYVLTGPEILTQAEQIRTIGEAIGRPVRWEEIPREDAREQLLADGFPLSFVDVLLDAYAQMVLAKAPVPITSTVREVTGAPAHAFREWATDHADDFRSRSDA